jgi:hypothetical protein
MVLDVRARGSASFQMRVMRSCFADHKLNPFSAHGVKAQLEGYQKLTRRCPAAVVSPKGLDSLLE